MHFRKLALCAAAALSISLGALMADDNGKPLIDDKPKTEKAATTKPLEAGKKTTTASGLAITVTQESAHVGAIPGDIVWVHYTGKLTTGEQFDSSIGQKPIKFTLGTQEIIKGWNEGIEGMKVGEKRHLVIPANLAYGPERKGSIPPNSILEFDVELIGLARPGTP
jgi:FKBP-type peptidyl-prolyl cis-trans isomerase